MASVENDNCIEVILPGQPIVIKPYDLNNVGYLHRQSTLVNCPSCGAEAQTEVRHEVVTRLQKFLRATNWCKTSESRYDVNHYCRICGCYIGRYIPISCVERWLSRQARKKAALDAMTLKSKPRDCTEYFQKARDRIKENQRMEKERMQE